MNLKSTDQSTLKRKRSTLSSILALQHSRFLLVVPFSFFYYIKTDDSNFLKIKVLLDCPLKISIWLCLQIEDHGHSTSITSILSMQTMLEIIHFILQVQFPKIYWKFEAYFPASQCVSQVVEVCGKLTMKCFLKLIIWFSSLKKLLLVIEASEWCTVWILPKWRLLSVRNAVFQECEIMFYPLSRILKVRVDVLHDFF